MSQHAAVESILPTDELQAIQVSPRILEEIQDWNNRQCPQRKRTVNFNTFLPVFCNHSEVEELTTPIRMCVMKMPDAPKNSRNLDLRGLLHTRLSKHKLNYDFDAREAICYTWTAIQYWLDNSGWATPGVRFLLQNTVANVNF